MNPSPKAWQWRPGVVDRRQAHFELRYGSATEGGWDNWLPVALVGPPREGVFPVQLLPLDNSGPHEDSLRSKVTRELDFYLVEKGESDPWAYAQYHCGTAANVYSSVHWSFFPPSDAAGAAQVDGGYPVNLFWDTRRLTQDRENHLTCFLAAALHVDPTFRAHYERCVLSSLGIGDSFPMIRVVETQPNFGVAHCRPDLLLRLADGRIVVCEHKLGAPETEYVADDGEVKLQIERYLELPVDGVAYFRTIRADAASQFTSNERYLHPDGAPHFLWRDLYEALSRGQHDVTRWLLDGFERLGFTPPVRHVGDLWPDDREEIRENQRNFAKLWDRARDEAARKWHVTTGRRCELYLTPMSPCLVTRVYISPIAQGGTLLRFRAEAEAADIGVVRDRLLDIAGRLPVEPQIVVGQLRNGHPYIDLIASLHLLLGKADTPEAQAERLFGQVIPSLDVLQDG